MLLVSCTVDQSMHLADKLLGEELYMEVRENMEGSELTTAMTVRSHSVDSDWETLGEGSLTWSSLELDDGDQISFYGWLDTFSLELTVTGDLNRINEAE